MTTCLVCDQDTVCSACNGVGWRWFDVNDYPETQPPEWRSWPCQCRVAGLSHTHPRKVRNRTRRAFIDILFDRVGAFEWVDSIDDKTRARRVMPRKSWFASSYGHEAYPFMPVKDPLLYRWQDEAGTASNPARRHARVLPPLRERSDAWDALVAAEVP